MRTNVMRALLLTSASVAMVATAAPTAAYAQEAFYQIDIPAQSMGDALRALGKATQQNIVFNGSLVKGKRSAAVKGRMSANEALSQMLAGSGLKMSRGSGGGFVVQAGNAGAAPASAPPQARASQAQGRGTITGTVKDETSGAALKGALVELVGTGRTTSTDDLGEFRFANVPAGDQTVRISYLGYVGQQSSFTVGAGEIYEQDFTLTGGSGSQEIVVYGSRSARAQALNQERAAENISTIVSSDTLGHFDGATISDALRRVPGVAFQQDEITGDGSNIIIRGLSPDYNTITLNGLRLPEGSGTGRSPSLGNILTDSIESVTINKSLLPNMDSSGTGGLVDIETKGPLDRARRFASFGIEGSRAAKGFLKEFSVNGTVSATFGADQNFGVSASVQYRERNIQRFNYQAFNAFYFPYLPLDSDGQPVSSPYLLDFTRPYPFEDGVDKVYPSGVSTGYNGAESRNLAITLSAQWKIGTHTELRFDVGRSQVTRDEYVRRVDFNPSAEYRLLPIPELNGQLRYALLEYDIFSQFGPGREGFFLSATQNYSFANDVKSVTDTYSFRGNTVLGALEANYTLGYASGSQVTPVFGAFEGRWRARNIPARPYINASLLSGAASNYLDPNGNPQSLFAPFGGSAFPAPLMTQAGFDLLRDPASWTLSTGGAVFTKGTDGDNKRYTAKGSVKYSFNNSVLKYIEVGGFFESARFSNSPVAGDSFIVEPASFNDLITYNNLGFKFTGSSLAPIGIAGGGDVVARADIENFFLNIDSLLASNPNMTRRYYQAGDPRLAETYTNEDNFSFYVMPRVEIGKLEIVGGFRLDRVNVRSRGLLQPQLINANGTFDPTFALDNAIVADGVARQTTILPRVAATWRRSDDFLVRAAFGMSVARPLIQYLSGAQNLLFNLQPLYGPNGNQPALNVNKTNPDLKPSYTQNFDLSFEKYFQDAGQIKIGLFYKRITNLVGSAVTGTSNSLDGVTIPDDTRIPDINQFFVTTSQLVNGDNPAEIYGFEAAAEKRFTFLPGALGGFGVYANYTYTKGERELLSIENGVNVRRKAPLTGAPKHSGTAALTYNKHGLDATLAYTMQGRRFDGGGNFGFDYYNESDSSLDFRAEYRFQTGAGQWRLWLEASDLLKGPGDGDVITTQGGANGVPKLYTGASYYGGRRATAGLSVNF